ncbi:MAG: ABC transporter ATP-binding protein [Clostridia bacterium]|nr:ABC transporter ATP-binding protein [Clostridia bacterium]
MEPLLSIRGLALDILGPEGARPILRVQALDLYPGEVLGLVGETGSGKTLTAMSVAQLFPTPHARIAGGSVRLAGRELVGAGPRELAAVRGRRVGVVFQDPSSSLNPVFPVDEPIVRALRVHRGLSRAAARAEAERLLERVGLPGLAGKGRYPHELSGGQRQRVMIALALAGDPEILIADEPTTALDVTVQAQILRLLAELQRERRLAVIFITHNVSLLAGFADRVAVMYAGDVVECGPTAAVLGRPQHPYTQLLLAAAPRLGSGARRLAAIEGLPPSLRERPRGCAFADRCPRAAERCRMAAPRLKDAGEMHQVACFFPGGEAR